MQHHQIVDFWEEVVENLKKRALPEAASRREISNYLRDLEQHGAELAVYHFGSDDAAEAIMQRIAARPKRRDATRRSRKLA